MDTSVRISKATHIRLEEAKAYLRKRSFDDAINALIDYHQGKNIHHN